MKKSYFFLVIAQIFGICTFVFWGCKTVELAKLTTLEVTEITDISAKSGGNITDDGGGEITIKGIVWDSHDSPTVDQHLGISSEGPGLDISPRPLP